MDLTAIIGVGFVGLLASALLRQYHPEFGVLVSLGTGVIIFLLLLRELTPVLTQLEDMLTRLSLPGGYLEPLIKGLGICLITHFACGICKDGGEESIADRIELAGKTAVLAVSLPLFREVLSLIERLVQF